MQHPVARADGRRGNGCASDGITYYSPDKYTGSADGHADSDQYADQYANGYADINANRHGNLHADRDTPRDSNSHAQADPQTDQHACADHFSTDVKVQGLRPRDRRQ